MISLQLQRYGGIACITGILPRMAAHFLGKSPERQGGGGLYVQQQPKMYQALPRGG